STPTAPIAKAPTVKSPSADPGPASTPTPVATAERKQPFEPTRIVQAPAAPAPTPPIPPAPVTPPSPPAMPTPKVTPAPNGSRLISLDFKDAHVVNLLPILGARRQVGR